VRKTSGWEDKTLDRGNVERGSQEDAINERGKTEKIQAKRSEKKGDWGGEGSKIKVVVEEMVGGLRVRSSGVLFLMLTSQHKKKKAREKKTRTTAGRKEKKSNSSAKIQKGGRDYAYTFIIDR